MKRPDECRPTALITGATTNAESALNAVGEIVLNLPRSY